MIGIDALSATPLSSLPLIVVPGVFRPNSDLGVAGWTASVGTDLYAMLDEPVPNDADYVLSPILDAAGPALFGLDGMLPAGAYRVRVRARCTETSGQARVQLLDASNVSRGASAWQPLTPAFTTYELLIATTGASTRLKLEVQP